MDTVSRGVEAIAHQNISNLQILLNSSDVPLFLSDENSTLLSGGGNLFSDLIGKPDPLLNPDNCHHFSVEYDVCFFVLNANVSVDENETVVGLLWGNIINDADNQTKHRRTLLGRIANHIP